MIITIEGNKHSFQLTGKTEMIKLSLEITISELNQPATFGLDYNGLQINLDASQFNNIAETIKGRAPIDVMFALERALPNNSEFSGSFLAKSQTETSLFQSLFVVYKRFDMQWSWMQPMSVVSKIYDDFAIEYTGQVGPAADIYFIKLQRISTENMNAIDRLIELNLLVKATFANNPFGHIVTAYFIPLLKPGVSRSHFVNGNDINGDRTYRFWKQILADRDERLQLWSTKRF